jgi:hypothetical protein
MVGEANQFILRKAREFLDSRQAIFSNQPNTGIAVIKFTNQARTQGTLPDGTVVNTVVSGCPQQTDVGYLQSDGSYLVHRDCVKMLTISTSGESGYYISKYYLDDISGHSLLYVQKGTSGSYAIDPASTGFPGETTFASFSGDGRHIALGAYSVSSNISSTATITLRWCVYINFTLNPTTNMVESTNIITGNKIISLSSLPLCSDPGAPASDPYGYVYFGNAFTMVPVGSGVQIHTYTGGLGQFSFNQDAGGNPILDFSCGISDQFGNSQEFGINCPTDPSLDTAYFITASNINRKSIVFSCVDLLNTSVLANTTEQVVNDTWQWNAPPDPVTNFTTDITGSFIVTDNGGISTGNIAEVFLGTSLNREALIFGQSGNLYLIPNYIGTIDPTIRTLPVVFTDTEYILAAGSPFIDNTYVNAKDSEKFYVYYTSGKTYVYKYTQNGATPPVLTNTSKVEVTPIDSSYTLMDWILK